MNDRDVELALQVELGRKQLDRHHFWLVLNSIASTIQYWMVLGLERAPQQLISFGLTVAFTIWIASGARFARLLAIASSWVTGFGLWVLFVMVYRRDPFTGLSLAITALTYLLYARALMWSEPINTYLRVRREGGARQDP